MLETFKSERDTPETYISFFFHSYLQGFSYILFMRFVLRLYNPAFSKSSH